MMHFEGPHKQGTAIFVLGADEYLERLQGKIRKYLFFYVKIFQNISVLYSTFKKEKGLLIYGENLETLVRVIY